ncbi:hypothetical protein B0H17DRAFT_929566, partial [Mycena rosella]
MLSRFLVLAATVLCISGTILHPLHSIPVQFFCLFAARYSLPPALQASQDSSTSTPAISSNATHIEKIVQTAAVIENTGHASHATRAPEGYELVFGPISAANDAPGYMGFALLDKYDPSVCAKLCNQREPDAVGGACKFFNIWRGLVKQARTTYTCAMYSVPTNASTAVNAGQGPL